VVVRSLRAFVQRAEDPCSILSWSVTSSRSAFVKDGRGCCGHIEMEGEKPPEKWGLGLGSSRGRSRGLGRLR
jgi:hypothetical protein